MSGTDTAPQQDFDSAVDAYLEATEAPVEVPAREQVVPSTPPAVAPAAAQAEPVSGEAPQTDVEARIAEAERKAAEAERRYWSAQGNLMQAQKRQELKDKELADYKKLLADEEARIARMYTDAITNAEDDTTRAILQLQYRSEKAERELARQTEERETTLKQQQEMAEWTRQQQLSALETGLRQTVTPNLVSEVARLAAQSGLPETEVADLRARILSTEAGILVNTLPINDPDPRKPDLNKYYTYMQAQLAQDIEQRRVAYEERTLTQNRAAATGTYRQELPVGQAGPRQRGLDEMDFDEAVDFLFDS